MIINLRRDAQHNRGQIMQIRSAHDRQIRTQITETKKAPVGAFFRGRPSKNYLEASAPKRLLKRSTRPPVDTSRCLPV